MDKIKQAIELMAHAKRPLFYTGGGVINSGKAACDLLRELVKLTGYPITSTLMGLGAFPAADPQWMGMLGMHGTLEANMAMHDCDVMICIGARFDDRITGRLDAFSPGSKKIHVDIDPVVDQQERQGRTCRSSAIARMCLRTWCGCGAPARCTPTRSRCRCGGRRSTSGARASRSPIGSRTT